MTAQFHRLAVQAVEPITSDAVRVVFAVPEPLREAYRYAAGQHLTIDFTGSPIIGEIGLDTGRATGAAGAAGVPAKASSRAAAKLRRFYSLCEAPPLEGPPDHLAIAVKRQGPGGIADYMVSKLAPGQQLDVLTPVGGFHAEPGTGHTGPDRITGIAAGSGITPILAIIHDALRKNPAVSAALIYGNRSAAEIMFEDELVELGARYGGRFEVLHVLSREDQGTPMLYGRIDRESLPWLLTAVGAGPGDAYYLCGPFGMVEDARAVLAGTGAQHVRFELYAASAEAVRAGGESTDTTAWRAAAAQSPATPVVVRLGGRTTYCELRPGDPSLLDAVLRERPEVPFACTDGICGTCRARLASGSVTMARDYALEPGEKRSGYILTCQALPTSAEVALDFDT
ncbi:MAG TPA: 2Fe-2S iron-sulfur cluster-binding protein [Actinocrinis sp.]|jgi:ring-1,2-phenylacetyl-CoA epoxidase subunit PaaE